MASEEPVHPLRISKDKPAMASSLPRALTEISPTEKRRNSPIWNQTTKKMTLNTDSSPFQSSPLDGTTSPRLFWKNRNLNLNSENSLYGSGASSSPSPTRRSSIERLQKASRVKNSNILALEQKQEYDPTRLPQVERPLAKVQGNAYGGTGVAGLRSGGHHGHQRSESKTSIPLYSPTKVNSPTKASASSSLFGQGTPTPALNPPRTPSKDQVSPVKSSLSTSKFKSSYDPDVSADASHDEDRELPKGKYLHRHAKSVTFDAAPPQVNEYEMATPDLSSIGSNSREGSFESEEDDEMDDDYEDRYGLGEAGVHQDDSFDASLEDTDKTPVVGPEDWRQESPTVTRSGHLEDPFEGSPMPEAAPTTAANAHPQQHRRTDSAASNSGDHRPLPPLPGMGHARSQSASSTGGLSATAERMLGAQRSLPSPPPASASKSDIQNIGNGRMPLEERLRLMMLSDGGKTAAEQQRERRMRRAGTRDRVGSATPERDLHSSPSQRIGTPDRAQDNFHDEEDDTIGDLSGLEEYQLPPRISRESILRRVNGNQSLERESDYRFSSPMPGSSPDRQLPLDPDVPIPSTEDSILEGSESSVIIHRDEDADTDVDVDLYEIPDLYNPSGRSEGGAGATTEELEDDTESHYSDDIATAATTTKGDEAAAGPEEELSTTPRATTPVAAEEAGPVSPLLSGLLPPVTNGTKSIDFSRGLQEYMLPKPVDTEGPKMADAQAYMQRPFTPPDRPMTKPEYDGSGWGDDDEYDYEEPKTPDSVIHHPMPDDETPRESPDIPEHVATIKASGSKLKTRPSATPTDLTAMREQRRQVSREIPGIPAIPERHRNRISRDMGAAAAELNLSMSESEAFLERHPSFKERSLTLDLDLGLSLDQDFERVIEAQKVAYSNSFHSLDPVSSAPPAAVSQPSRNSSRNASNSSMNSDNTLTRTTAARQASDAKKKNAAEDHKVDAKGDDTKARAHKAAAGRDGDAEDELTTNANITRRKLQRGYLMRQNTKVVSATDQRDDFRGARSAGNSPVKQDRPQSWTVEPWIGQARKKSVRKRTGIGAGPVPPLPGQESNVAGLNPLTEEDVAAEMATEESGERGRLFVKVMGVKDLDLPLPKNERTWFSLTLDNGVHCVTTAWLELARNAPIGQEFELVVPNDLEFQLTLNVKLTRPPPPPQSQQLKSGQSSPTKISRAKTSTFSRVFASPKKRKEMEQRHREEEERLAREQREAQARQQLLLSRQHQPTAWDLLSPLAAEDGSFARSYVCLKEHESRCFGRPYLVEVAAFNEWAAEEAAFASSVKSKRGGIMDSLQAQQQGGGVVRRAPYKVGKLELQLLFVPRPKGATDDDMPKSMNSCIREMRAAEERLARNWEGHLSQQGGDCPYWRRRYFKLVGTKLTAYHEATRQPRATINLANAKRLIDDRRALTEKETTGKGGKRRRSAFAEEEEGYMFVEEGFRIRFNNGEIIDFYADTALDKEGWMKVLSEVIGRDSLGSNSGAAGAGGGGGDDDSASASSRAKGKWCELVLKKEEALRRRAEGRRVHSRTKSMYL